ncbi:MAG TPA: hypothetical protein VKF80_06815 [Candidatus Eisenbacteria bacterium]|nr:hypothetical protein [Candidatus Eisenbacteria bacterium]
MKRIHQLVLIGAASAVLGLGAVSAQAGTPDMNRREAWQRARIEQGVHSGRLTRGEARRLRRGERRIHRMDNRFGRDGFYGPRERMRMHRALDRENARIWRLKHNRRDRV